MQHKNLSPIAARILHICDRAKFTHEIGYVFHPNYMREKLELPFGRHPEVTAALQEMCDAGIMEILPDYWRNGINGYRRIK